jgi:hypothetical protein
METTTLLCAGFVGLILAAIGILMELNLVSQRLRVQNSILAAIRDAIRANRRLVIHKEEPHE